MSYDSMTGLPLEESFIDNTKVEIIHTDEFPFYIMAIRLPILNNTAFLSRESNKNFLLSCVVHKLIRSCTYMGNAYRMDDDTFIILVNSLNLSCDQLQDELNKAFSGFTAYCSSVFSGTTVNVHAGLYHISDKDISLKKAISNACSVFKDISDKQPTKIITYRESVQDLQKVEYKIIPAIEENWKSNHVLVYLQPKYNLNTMEMDGAEALVRILDTEGHMVKPGFFLPILQKNNLSCEMDLMIVEKVLRLIVQWNNFGITPVPISVNLSENSLYDPFFEDIFSQLMNKYNTVSHFLRIEVTESAYLRNPYHINQVIDFIHSFGCMVELDDYGKNSITYTSDTIPNVDYVKLSQSLWSNAMRNSITENIFYESLDILHKNNIACIGECVEQDSEMQYLKAHGVTHAQGFLFSRPVPFDIFQKRYMSFAFSVL